MKNRSRKKLFVFIGVFLVLVLLAILLLIIRDQRKQNSHIYSGENYVAASSAEEIEYDGKKYQLNNRLMSVALIGVDSGGPLTAKSKYGEAGQADSITLVLLDREKENIQLLPLSRDTITKVHHFTAQGYDDGTLETHLGFAYTFGDGGKASCSNTCLAISDLLKGVGVHFYAATNLDSLAFINQIMEGVTVTVPNNDIAHLHPECTAGAVVTLNDDTVNDFLRYRNTDITGSNNGRMERNRAFYEGFISKVKKLSKDDLNGIWEKIQSSESNILTSFSQSQYLEVMEHLHDYSYDQTAGRLSLIGNNTVVDGYDAFYPDQNALMKLIVSTFYKEKK